MIFGYFDQNRTVIEEQYRRVVWNESTGWTVEHLETECNNLADTLEAQGYSREMIKARLFEMVMDHAQLSVVPQEFFQDHINHGFILQHIRGKWVRGETEGNGPLAAIFAERSALYKDGICSATYDFGHTVPDWYDIERLGFTGLLRRVEETHARMLSDGLSREQEDFFTACEITYRAVLRFIARLAAECRRAAREETEPANTDRLNFCAGALEALCVREPRNTHEALQTAYLFHILQEEIEGERLRSLGCLDRVYKPFYDADMLSGTFTVPEVNELYRDFFQKFHALTGDQLFGEPMCLGGTYADGKCSVNELTWIILDSYDALDIANPKFHIRVSRNTPKAFIARICDMIRGGNSSFVFVSDECAVPMMMKVGATEAEAHEFVPIGCYEPGILGREVACTGNGGFNLPKMMELALHNGIDPVTGKQIGPCTGTPESFDTFDKLLEAVRTQMKFMTDKSASIIVAAEKDYMRMNPAPLFSATMIECVEKGMDAFAGGAKYNNSSIYMYSNATLADSLAAIKHLVYEAHEFTLTELVDILDHDWEGHETLRLRMLRSEDKWGNNRELPDQITVNLCEEVARYGNSLKNGRGGRFKVAMYTIDFNYYYGEHTGATADGRHAGAILSRNLGASSGMDRNGITALMRSCTKLDLTEFPTGTVVDIMLHPTSVAGEEGLNIFVSLITSFIEMGGYAIHGNVFDAKVLRAAQENPDQYRNLQVRVCGWNVYFVNLNRKEQDEFIHRAELAAG